MSGKGKLLSSVAVTIMCTAYSGNLFAAEAEEEGDTDTFNIEEVVVTSRKKEEHILDVPLAITAFDARLIESAAIDNLSDVAALTPGLNFYNPIGESLSTPIIRGVAQTDIRGENNTAVFIDGVFVSSRIGVNMSQLDIARIEVIKGPQSALYGRTAFSGAINIVTAEPGDEVRGKLSGTVGNAGKYTMQGSVSGPIVPEKLSGRIAGSFDTWDGSYKNKIEGGPDIGGYEYRTINGSLRFTPNENFKALVTGYYSYDKIDNSPLSAVHANCEDKDMIDGQGLRYQNFCGVLPSIRPDSLYIDKNATGTKRETTRFSLKMEWDSGVGVFESLTGYGKVNNQVKDDFTRGDNGFDYVYLTTDGHIFSIPGFADFFAPGSGRTDTFKLGLLDSETKAYDRDYSQEFRYSTPVENSIRGSIGVFYFNSKSQTAVGNNIIPEGQLPADFQGLAPLVGPFQPFGPGLDAFIPIGDSIFASFLDFNVKPTDGTFSPDSFDKDESISGFGYVEGDLAEGLVARGEVRYTSEKRSFRDIGDRPPTGEVGINCAATGNVIACDKRWKFWTTRLSLEYHPNEDWLLFATAAKGEKAGGFDSANISPSLRVFSSFSPESNWTYEVGAKGRMLDGRLIAEISFYYIDWSDIVVPQVADVIIPGSSAALPLSVNKNAGTAKVTGVEFSAQAILAEGLSVNVGASYTNSRFTNARIDSFKDFPSFAPNGDVSGKKLLRQPKWQLSVSPLYETSLSETVDVFARTDVTYEGRSFVGNANQAIIPGRIKVNARTGVKTASGFEVELWVENLFNDNKAEAAFRDVFLNNTADGVTSGFNAIFPWRMTVIHPRLRTYGVTVRQKF